MQTAQDHAAVRHDILNETLFAAASFGVPDLFNIEWLIDQAERGAWGGLWW